MDSNILYYVHDPMCSWCWGYQPTWQMIKQSLPEGVMLQYLVGGLAPDSDVPMPEPMQHQIAAYWHKIEDYLGTEFNHDFWKDNTPRRSTYPACRSVLAARAQGAEQAMITAIQHAYYLHAKNPSDVDVHIGLAQQLNLNVEQFTCDMASSELNQQLFDEIAFARSIGGNSFPSLFLKTAQDITELPIDYQDSAKTLAQIDAILRR